MNSFFNSQHIIDILLKWKLQLLVVVVAAILLSALFSSPIFITPLYKSNCLLYPSNISPYSDESETEQSVQIFQSRDIRDSLVKKFNLAKHWGIDSSYIHFESTLVWEYSQRVHVNKTPFEAVEIEVLDQDPVMARDLIVAMLDAYNKKIRAMHKAKFGEVVLNYNYIMGVKKGYLDSLKTRAEQLGLQYGLLDYQAQTREVMRAYLSTGGGSVRSAEAKAMKKNLEEKGGEMLLLSEMMRSESDAFSTMKMDADRAVLDYNRDYTYVNVLSKPFVADKKAYPIRWLIVVFSTLAAFFMAILIIGLIERGKFRGLSTDGNEG
jgi:capsular polysaccharide biosynthesis protein